MKTHKYKWVLQSFLLAGIFLFIAFQLQSANAPVTKIGKVCNAEQNQRITIPINVTGFTNIGSFYLNLEYDYSKIQFLSGSQNSALPGDYSMNDVDRGNGIHRIVMSWSGGIDGVSLPDGSSIVNLVFNYTSGPATLRWYTSGPYCKYTDPKVVDLSDLPKSDFYINGEVSSSCSALPTVTPGGPTSFCEGGSVTLTASAGSAWKWAPGGETTQSITVTSSGSYSVQVTDASGANATSAATEVTVNQKLTPTVSITASANPSCYGERVTFTASPVNGGETPSYQWKKGNASVGTNSASYTDDGMISGNISVVMTSSITCVTSTTANSNVIDFKVNATGQWLGTTSNDWNTASNWCGGVPTSSTNVFIPSGVAQPVIGVTVSASCNNISLAGGSTLTLKSDASGTGSLIVSGVASGEGRVVAERFMTTDTWHLVSSPLSGQSISSFLGSNPNIAEEVTNPEIRGMMDYNPTVNDWNSYFTNSASGSLGGGKGFSMRTDANVAVKFTGSLQTGSQAASGLVSDKWNCIGNPYTSAIKINGSGTSFLSANITKLDPSFGAVYVWDQPNDDNNGVYGKYSVYSNASGAFEVQQGQAFLVHMDPASQNIEFNREMQVHNTGLALKSSNGLWPTIKLEAKLSNQKNSTILTFGSGMTKGLDPTYDAGLLRGGSDLFIYSKLANDNGVPFAIQALPAEVFSNLMIPVGIESKKGGELSISSDFINLSADWKVILEDKLSKTFTDLSDNDYRVAILANSNLSDRFVLHISNLRTGLDPHENTNSLSAFAIRNTEMIIHGKIENQAMATIFDVQGRLVLGAQLSEGSQHSIALPGIKTGIYLLVVKDKTNIHRIKVSVNE